MAEVIETARSRLPAWAVSSLPEEPTELKAEVVAWLREHAGQLRSIGQDVWRALLHILFGMVIGGMVCARPPAGGAPPRPLVAPRSPGGPLLRASFPRPWFAPAPTSSLTTPPSCPFLLAAAPWVGL